MPDPLTSTASFEVFTGRAEPAPPAGHLPGDSGLGVTGAGWSGEDAVLARFLDRTAGDDDGPPPMTPGRVLAHIGVTLVIGLPLLVLVAFALALAVP